MLEKFIKKDKNEQLEKILEEKEIEEQAKNLLQGILYKIEVSYKDYKKAKVTNTTEKEYVEEILRNIEDKCNQIKTIKLSQKVEDEEIQKELEKNKFYIGKKEILSYPIEEKILYAIEKKANIKKIVNNKYDLITISLSDFINTGKDIDRIEVLRDFNGWSWTTIKTEIENIQANLIYQTLRILLEEEFLNSWCQDADGIIDYVEIMKKEIERKYGDIISEKIVEQIFKISIVNEADENSDYKNRVQRKLEQIERKIGKFSDTKRYVKEITENKKNTREEIKEIEQILNQDSKIKQEYERINLEVPLEKKIFSIKVLKQQLNEKKQQLLNKIEESNYYLNPTNYMNEKNKMIKEKELLEVINFNEKQKEELLIEYIRTFLECFEIMIKKEEEQEKIIKIMYKFRYFMLLPFNLKKSIKNINELEKEFIKTEKIIVKKAEEKKVITNVPIEIMRHVFETRIISLEELYYKIIKEEEKYFVQIFDENITEEKFEINPTEKTKINKKTKIFI